MRRTLITLGTLALALALAAPAAMARPGSGTYGPNVRPAPAYSPPAARPGPAQATYRGNLSLERMLSLTPRQAMQLRSLERSTQATKASLERQLRDARRALASAQAAPRGNRGYRAGPRGNANNRATINRLNRQIAQLERQLVAVDRAQLARARAILSPAQFYRYSALVRSGRTFRV